MNTPETRRGNVPDESAPLDLTPIRERLAAASAGPWRTHDTHLDWGGYTHTVLGPERREPGSQPGWERLATEGIAWCPTFEGSPRAAPRNAQANAAFIAASYEDVTVLLAEVERLRAILDDSPPYHVMDLREDGFTIKHPISCRPDLFNCPVNRVAHAMDGPPVDPGQWHVDMAFGQLVFVEREEPARG